MQKIKLVSHYAHFAVIESLFLRMEIDILTSFLDGGNEVTKIIDRFPLTKQLCYSFTVASKFVFAHVETLLLEITPHNLVRESMIEKGELEQNSIKRRVGNIPVHRLAHLSFVVEHHIQHPSDLLLLYEVLHH